MSNRRNEVRSSVERHELRPTSMIYTFPPSGRRLRFVWIHAISRATNRFRQRQRQECIRWGVPIDFDMSYVERHLVFTEKSTIFSLSAREILCWELCRGWTRWPRGLATWIFVPVAPPYNVYEEPIFSIHTYLPNWTYYIPITHTLVPNQPNKLFILT